MVSLTQQTAALSLSGPEKPEPPSAAALPPPAKVSTNPVVAGEWADAIKVYDGPKLSDRALNPAEYFIGTEKLDTILRTSAFGLDTKRAWVRWELTFSL
jgi:hypothetical protein